MKSVFGGTVALMIFCGLSVSANDSEILQTVKTANEGEVTLGEMALNKAYNPKVRDFAQEMIDHHTQSNQELNTIADDTSLSGKENSKSRGLAKDSKVTASKLRPLTGKAFDKAYIDAQVKGHEEVLKNLDESIPQTLSISLKASLEATRPRVEAHLKKAKQIQSILQ